MLLIRRTPFAIMPPETITNSTAPKINENLLLLSFVQWEAAWFHAPTLFFFFFCSTGLGRQALYQLSQSLTPSLCLFVCLFWWAGVWTQGFVLAKQVLTLLLEPQLQFICSGYFGNGSLLNYLSRLALNHNSPNLSIPSNLNPSWSLMYHFSPR
jgi:hypothetical protein